MFDAAHEAHGLTHATGRVSFRLAKACAETDWWHPLERGVVKLGDPAVEAMRLSVRDPLGRVHAEALLEPGAGEACFVPRGAPGWQTAELRAAEGGPVLASARFRVVAATSLSTDHAPMEQLFGDLAGSFEEAQVHFLLPQGFTAAAVTLGDDAQAFDISQIEESLYVDFEISGLPLAPVHITLQAT